MERESFIFYRSFYDSIKGLGDAEFAECMRFLCEYGLNGAEHTGGGGFEDGEAADRCE